MREMNEKGVSPVIGVILMVAITVILAAVIASFVFGMSSIVKPTKTPSFTVTRIDDSNVQIVLTSKGGASTIENCNVASPSGAKLDTHTFDVGTVGNISSINEGSHLIVKCTVDGRDQVVLDTIV